MKQEIIEKMANAMAKCEITNGYDRSDPPQPYIDFLDEITTQEERKDIAQAAYAVIEPYLEGEWLDIKDAPKETGVNILAIIKGFQTGKQKTVVLERVNHDDCTWHFDGSEISYSWTPTHFKFLPTPPKE